MNLSEPFIRRPVATSLLALGLLLLGLVSYRRLPVAPLPRVDFPVVQVSATGVDVAPRLEVLSVAEPPARKGGRKVGSLDELLTELKGKGLA